MNLKKNLFYNYVINQPVKINNKKKSLFLFITQIIKVKTSCNFI